MTRQATREPNGSKADTEQEMTAACMYDDNILLQKMQQKPSADDKAGKAKAEWLLNIKAKQVLEQNLQCQIPCMYTSPTTSK